MKGIQNAVDLFIEQECPYFLLTDSRSSVCLFKNDKIDNLHEASKKLETALKNLDSDSKAIYKIYLFAEVPEKGLKGEPKKIISNGEHELCFDFSPYNPERKEVSEDVSYQRALWKIEREQKEREQAARLERIEALLMAREIQDNADEDEDIEEAAEPKSVMGALVNNPQIQSALAGAVSAWLSKIMSPAAAPYAVAGLPESDNSDRINAAIAILSEYDDQLPEHLEKLAIMAQKDTGKFKFLLTML